MQAYYPISTQAINKRSNNLARVASARGLLRGQQAGRNHHSRNDSYQSINGMVITPSEAASRLQIQAASSSSSSPLGATSGGDDDDDDRSGASVGPL